MSIRTELISYTFATVNTCGAVVRRETSQITQFIFDIGSGQELAMLSLPGANFQMGSEPREGYDDEKPRHSVTVRPFLIGRFPITQGQWAAVMDEENACRFRGPNKAMHNVSWTEAVEFCRRLAAVTGHMFRLPAEAEWEYACRGGTTTAFSCGPAITTDLANYNGEFAYMDAPKGPYRHVLLDVGAFPPNPFGLHDMHGNLWEWCADPWHENYEGVPVDGSAWEEGSNERYRLVRGGSWHETPDLCRSAVRLKLPYNEGDEMTGFRLANNLA
jgi:formylglycine-generating enzyme required for sulfatase activity